MKRRSRDFQSAILADFVHLESRGELWPRGRLPFCIPPSARSLLRGSAGARRQLALLLRLHRPVGYVSSRNLVRRVRRKDFSGPSEMQSFGLGSRAPRLASPGVTRTGSGNSTNRDEIMYQNKVNHIGFLGGDAEIRNTNNRSFTTLSLATKSSFKDKKSGQ